METMDNDRTSHIVAVEPLDGYRVWCKFDDGFEGTADYSDLAEHGYYERWTTEPGFFESVVPDGFALRWDDWIDQTAEQVRARMLGLDCWSFKREELRAHMGELREYPDIVAAAPLPNYSVLCEFADGAKGVADLSAWAKNAMYEKWRTRRYFDGFETKPSALVWDDYTAIGGECIYEKIVNGGVRA